MNDAVDVVEIRQPFKHGEGDLTDDIDVNGTNLLVDAMKRALVHELHTYAYVRIGQESAKERNNVFGIAVVHYVQLP